MESVLLKLKIYVELFLQGMGVLVIFATVMVRLTKTKKDDHYVSKAWSLFEKICAYLPTIGLNPKTKALIDANKDLKESLAKLPQSESDNAPIN